MPFIETAGVAKVAVNYKLYGNDVVNTLWFERVDETEWSLPTLSLLAASTASWVELSMLPVLSNDMKFHSITATAQFASTAPSYYYAGDMDPGEIVSGALPGSDCITVTFKTGARGRSYRGRNYISGIPSVHWDENAVSSAWALNVLGAYGGISDIAESNECIHVVVSHFTNGAARPSGVSVPVIAYALHDYNIDNQRRRLNGRGS